MRIAAKTFKEYLEQVPAERREPLQKLRETIKENLPEGFEERFAEGFIQYIVPFELYPEGYHANPKEPLPFIAIGSQKNFIALYHLGIYAFKDILDWFTREYSQHVPTKLDMGKSCIRFKNVNQIPYNVIAELVRKISVSMCIEKYESAIKKNDKNI